MAMDLSHNSPNQESFFSAILFGKEGSAGFGNYMSLNWELENSQSEKTDKVSDDILDLLPSDPFGMDLSTTFTAITGWLEDIENDLGLSPLGFCTDQVGTDQLEMGRREDQLFAGLNLVWNGAVIPHSDIKESKIQEVDNSKIQEVSIGSDTELEKFQGGYIGSDTELQAGLCDGGNDCNSEFVGFSYEKRWVLSNAADEYQSCAANHLDGEGGAPHDALFFALGYLGVRDLLSIERVCKSFRDSVQNDPLVWRSIHIDQPLSDRITDDDLVRLTSRAQGNLQCLSLVECLRITDSGLRHVLESNPGLTKLSVPGCVRLSVEGILCNLRALKSAGKLGVKHLRIGGIYGITNRQFEELKFLLGAENHKQLRAHKPRFYGGGQLYLSCNDDRAIDIEACPRCQKFRQVYDCPAESCQGKHQSSQLCRACTICIARCIHCGRCINGCDYEETFCLDLLCLDCWKQLLNWQNRQEEMSSHSSKCAVYHQQTRYHFCLYG